MSPGSLEGISPTRIDWATHVWNPVTGCLRGCPYCYARRWARRFPKRYAGFRPLFHPERLQAPLALSKPAVIFVCSMGELFGEWVPRDWTECVLQVAGLAPRHQFVFLSKAWPRPLEFSFPENCVVGISHEGGYRPTLAESGFCETPGRSLLCLEPLLHCVRGRALEFIDYADWVIVGAQTGPGVRPLELRWVAEILEHAEDQNTPTFVKDNLRRAVARTLNKREVPW